MKRILAILLVVAVILGITACTQKQSVQEETVTQADHENKLDTADDYAPEVIHEAEVVPEPESECVEIPERQPAPEDITQKLRNAVACSCLAMEYAQWKLMQWGYTGYDGHEIEYALSGFDGYLREQYETLTNTYGELLNHTLWILDTNTAGYVLQIVRVEDGCATQAVALQLNEQGVSVLEGEKPLEGTIYATCDIDCAHESPKKVFGGNTEQNDRLFYRISSQFADAEVGGDITISQETPDAVTWQMESYYSVGIAWKEIPLSGTPTDIKPVWTQELDDILNKIEWSDPIFDTFSETEYDETMLRYYLMQNWDSDTEVTGAWTQPLMTTPTAEFFGVVRVGVQNLLAEMEQNPELRAAFESMPRWRVSRLNERTCEIGGTTSDGRELTAKIGWCYVLVDGFTLSYQKQLQKLAEEAQNAEQIPQSVKDEMVAFLPEYAYYEWDSLSGEIAGYDEHGRLTWTWHVQEDGGYRLQCDIMYNENTEQQFVRTYEFEWKDGNIRHITPWS